jgi:hypothetical protein
MCMYMYVYGLRVGQVRNSEIHYGRAEKKKLRELETFTKYLYVYIHIVSVCVYTHSICMCIYT